MTNTLRYRIAAAIESVRIQRDGDAADMADAVIRELGPIPDRCHVDDQGRVWEWCGGQPGTWAWRITRLDNR